MAISWSAGWRARAALSQGFFLAALGLGVIAAAAYRAVVLHEPEAGLMGIFGAMALAVNVASALVLLKHRHGDANVRAVWLFSRNDAIGNVAVIVAAGLPTSNRFLLMQTLDGSWSSFGLIHDARITRPGETTATSTR